MIRIQISKNTIVHSLQKTHKIIGSVKTEKETYGITLVFNRSSMKITGASETRHIRISMSAQNTNFDNEAEVGRSVSTDFRKLLDILSGVRGDLIDIEVGESTLKVVGEKSKFTLPLMAKKIEEEVVDKGHVSSVSSKDLLQILKYIQFSSSSETSRPILSSVKVSASPDRGSLFVTTDGFRLSLVRSLSSFVEDDKHVQIPVSYFRDVISGVIDSEKDVKISFSTDDRCVFEQDEIFTWSKMVIGEFPPYEKVLFSEYQVTVSSGRQELLDGVRAISVMSRDYSNVVILDLKKEQIDIRTKKEVGGENIVTVGVVSTSGLDDEQRTLAFNAKYLIDFLSIVTDDIITFRINRPDSPALFLPGLVDHNKPVENLGFRHIIMPIRISE